MIHVDRLTRYYGDACAVDGISFHIRKGEIVGLLGPNGAGKTTTLRMLTGFLAPSSGTIRIQDIPIEQDPLGVKKCMGYLPESAPLYPDMLVADYLDYVADIRQLPKIDKGVRILELVELCDLAAVMHKPVSELSKGYKQRVGLAHALMSDPDILVLDEPTSGLDPNQIVEIREIIRRIGTKKTIILSTHILSEAEATCDRIMIIHQGKLVADGTTESIKQSAGGLNLLHLVFDEVPFDTVRPALEQVPGVSEIRQIGDHPLHVRLTIENDAARKAVYGAIRSQDWMLLEMRPESRSLEAIFRDLTQEN
ncbi:ABC transporter ATP-binding protein [Desulfatirhabdium butyrativorans]|uniref:ABC transporter ATP-binding protein n=1 Tax=Desulfatirhabdium butyrativorans TaxID=340467 RepID=UPI00040BED60|nr:ATP-binding cassette domain-containing protein [Desulfatirhabdium butyrativorans]